MLPSFKQIIIIAITNKTSTNAKIINVSKESPKIFIVYSPKNKLRFVGDIIISPT
jgi:hypothetical protein